MLFVVTSVRGFPLGEHLVVGWDEPCLYRELLHVPMFLRYPDSRYAMRRAAGLVEPRDLTQLLSNWFSNSTDLSPTALPLPTREFSISRNRAEMLLRTHVWHVRFPRYTDDLVCSKVGWSNRSGRSIHVYAGSGFNFDSDLTLFGATVKWPVGDRLRFSYDLTNLDLEPDPDNESTVIHVFETRYSFNPDLFVKLFVQTNSAIDKENIQLLGVWRFEPPFGSLQVAFQRGTSDQGQQSQQGNSVFAKLSWVF